MSDSSGPPGAESSDRLRAALEAGAQRLRALDVSSPTDSFVRAVLKLFRDRDPAQTLNTVERAKRDLDKLAEVLTETYQQARKAERADADAEPYGEAWMNWLRRDLGAIPTYRGKLARWTDAWTDALAAMKWSRCDEIAALVLDQSERAPRQEMTSVAAALRADRPLAALPATEALLLTPFLPAPATVRLEVLRARILRRYAEDLTEAERAADAAIRASSGADQSLRTLAQISKAEVYLDLGRTEEANELLQPAMQRSEASVELVLATAAVAVAQRRFGRANELYDAAVSRFDGEVVEPRLLRHVPGNLLWRWSRRLAATDKAGAVTVLEQALSAGIKGNSDYPAKKATVEKGQILEELGHNSEAAHDYRIAAGFYAWSESPRSIELLERARTLAPEVAEYHWSYGDAIRRSATDVAGRVDEDALHRAAAALQTGFDKAEPGPENAWALVSAALVRESLSSHAGEAGDEPALLFERALLLDPGYARALALLSSVLRRQGYAAEAFRAASSAHELDFNDFFAVRQLALGFADQGDFGLAVAEIEEYLEHRPADAEALVQKAQLVLGADPESALATLARAPAHSVSARFLSGMAYDLLGAQEDARSCFEQLWNQREQIGQPAMTTWSAFRIGRHDEAATLFAELADQAPREGYGIDLGQVLLVRGAQRDVEEGKRILLAGIDAELLMTRLRMLTAHNFPVLRREVAGRPHEAAVLTVLAEIVVRLDERLAFLSERTRDPGRPAVQLAVARQATADGNLDAALRTLVDLYHRDGPPETILGINRAAQRLQSVGDRLLAGGDLPAASAQWQRVYDVLTPLPGDLTAVQALRARIGFARLEASGAADEQAATLLASCDEPVITEALRHFARDVATLWAHYDGLRTLADGGGQDAGEKLRAAARDIPLRAIYSLERRSEAADRISGSVVAAEICLGAQHGALIGSPYITRGIAEMRDRLTTETGVKIPGVRVRYGPALPAGSVEFLVYERRVSRCEPSAGMEGADLSEFVLQRFEQVLSDNLFRLMSVDDVDLWQQGWDVLETPDPATWTASDPFSRLRLVRLLRMLLREGVSIRERGLILGEFTRAELNGESEPLAMLRRVRRKLFPTIVGGDPNAAALALPQQLQARVAGGLASPTGSVWELDRGATNALVTDLRSWRVQELPPGPVVIRVDDWRVRPYAWHLLADQRPRIYVVADEELP